MDTLEEHALWRVAPLGLLYQRMPAPYIYQSCFLLSIKLN